MAEQQLTGKPFSFAKEMPADDATNVPWQSSQA